MTKSAPSAPSPTKVAAAQTGTNIGTSIANAELGFVNQVTPEGKLSYDRTGSYSWYDPASKKTYDIPNYTATTTMSPELKRLYDTGIQTQQGLANIGNQQTSKIGSMLNNPFSYGNAQVKLPTLNGYLPNAGSITKTYGTDFSKDRQRVEDALMARMNPYLERDKEALRTQLVNQGFSAGDEGYSRGMEDFNRQANDARLGAILSAGQEQSRLTGLEAARAAFRNAAQAQQFGQGLSTADYRNQMLQTGFGNQMSLQQFLDQRKLAQRNQPINEITALLSGSQVSSPNYTVAKPPQIPTVDYAGLTYDSYDRNLQNFNQQNAYNQQLYGSILGLGGKVATGGF